MRNPQSVSNRTGTPRLPGRTPHRSALRLPGGEALLARGQPPDPRASRTQRSPTGRTPAREAT